MTVKLVILKSGEDVLADVQEMVVENKVIGYFFNNPCMVKLKKVHQNDEEENLKTLADVSLYPWMPLSEDKKIPVTVDWVVTIVEPVSTLKDMYYKTFAVETQND
jgi:hypothetical protein